MSATAAQIAALVLGLASAASWGAVATSGRPVRRGSWWVVAAVAAVTTLGTVAATIWLWSLDWLFAADRVVTAVPLALAALAWFAIVAARDLRRGADASWQTRTAAWGGVFAAAASVVVPLALGAPLPLWTAVAVALLVIGATAIAGILLAHPPSRRPLAVAIASAGAVAVVAVALGVVGAASPAPLTAAAHGHEPSALQGVPAAAAASVDVTDLRTDDAMPADVVVDLEARQETVVLDSGRSVEAWLYGAPGEPATLGGTPIEATVGDLVEVTLHSRDIDEGVTIHWHGYPVPNGEDGVAGVTQDAVAPGESFTYRFAAGVPGTYWYHTHQRSSEGVVKGLYGTLVVHPAAVDADVLDVAIPIHTFGGNVVFGESDEARLRTVAPGTDVRLRLINTDQVTHSVSITGSPFRVQAIDGTDAATPAVVEDDAVHIPAGGRYDLGFTMPDSGVRVSVAASRDAYLGLVPHEGAEVPERAASAGLFDPLAAADGEMPAWASEPFDVQRTMVLDRLPRLTSNGPAYAYTVDGTTFPHIEPTVVEEGDTVEITIVNRGFEVHPMHPHGHRVLVLEVNGRALDAPLWLDSFDVGPGEVWRVGLVADNPGIWMDHCHNLEHAALGMVTHLAYRGVLSPFEHGGAAHNAAE